MKSGITAEKILMNFTVIVKIVILKEIIDGLNIDSIENYKLDSSKMVKFMKLRMNTVYRD